MIQVAQYIAATLADRGIRQVFMVTGGGAMFLNDAIGADARLAYWCNHHEQAAAIAAEGFARVAGTPAAVCVTAGPGGVNALNGVFGAWTDSIPVIVVSGQSKRETLLATYDLKNLRQLGDQEVDIIRMVAGITKYAVLLTDPKMVPYHIERALHLATTGRPGPVWLDVPVDVQSSMIEPAECRKYDPREDAPPLDRANLQEQVRQALDRIASAKRPVILAGTGVRLAGAVEFFEQAVKTLGIPVTTAWTHDIIASDDPYFCGRQGTIGDRAGNFAVQNSDLLLVLGSRLPIRQISYNWKMFARHAYKIWVEIDPAELQKPTVQPDLPIVCDVKLFLEELLRQAKARQWSAGAHSDWVGWCKQRVTKYPTVLPKHRDRNRPINAYHFMEVLFSQLNENDIVVCGDATACIVPFQTAKLKRGQRMFSNSGCASMGWDLPAAIGAAAARPSKRIICLAGDGSIQMNLQELQTIRHHHLPIKIFHLSNGGYLSIRTTQKNFFGRQAGAGPESGVTTPDITKVAAAYGIESIRIDTPDFAPLVATALASPTAFIADVVLDQAQTFEPRLSSRQLADGRIVTRPLEDMFPFLDKEELLSNLLIPYEE